MGKKIRNEDKGYDQHQKLDLNPLEKIKETNNDELEAPLVSS